MILNAENIEQFISQEKCVKQTTIAIIVNNGKAWIGSNWCRSPQLECPRKGLPTGVGYELCKLKCRQDDHAEVNACMLAGKKAAGGVLYLIGHTYCCDNCMKVIHEHGIKHVFIGEYPTEEIRKICYTKGERSV
jgi:deoxycytidylate deaminase